MIFSHIIVIWLLFNHLCINGAIQPFKKFPTGANPHPKKYLKGAIQSLKRCPTGAIDDIIIIY